MELPHQPVELVIAVRRIAQRGFACLIIVAHGGSNGSIAPGGNSGKALLLGKLAVALHDFAPKVTSVGFLVCHAATIAAKFENLYSQKEKRQVATLGIGDGVLVGHVVRDEQMQACREDDEAEFRHVEKTKKLGVDGLSGAAAAVAWILASLDRGETINPGVFARVSVPVEDRGGSSKPPVASLGEARGGAFAPWRAATPLPESAVAKATAAFEFTRHICPGIVGELGAARQPPAPEIACPREGHWTRGAQAVAQVGRP